MIDTTIDSRFEIRIASEMSRKSCPTSSPIRKIGRNTTQVARVEPRIAPATSCVPASAARRGSLPISMWRTTFSSTTIELSISVPIANARPARLTTLIVRPIASMTITVATTASGTLVATITMLRHERRNTTSVSTASSPPCQMLSSTRLSASSM